MSNLVPYAGFDPTEFEPVAWRRAKARRRQSKRAQAYNLFTLGGKDTADIAEIMDRPEHKILKWLTIARCHAHGLEIPYGAGE